MALEIPGEDAAGVVDALEFNRTYNLRGSVPVGKNVVVVGGGNSAVDAARTAMRLGAETVTIVYRRTRDAMPAYAEEVTAAVQEGVALQMLTLPEAVLVENGKAVGLRCSPMHLTEFDRTGRRRPVAEGESFTIAADQIITAVGQRLDLRECCDGFGLETNYRKFVNADPVTGQTSVPWLFAGGDCVTGPDSVVGAVAAGERAAVGIDQLLTGQQHGFWREDKVIDTDFDPDADPCPFAREKMPTISVERRRRNFEEVEQCWTAPTALGQARRCLRCDYGKRG
jgi:NADH-quinone oxidoreductase subunit F